MQHVFRLTFLSVLFLTFLSVKSFAQIAEERPRKAHLMLATGIDNHVGLLGVSLEYQLVGGLTAYGGAGISTWGFKLSPGLRYYFDYPRKWALNAGYSYSTGAEDLEVRLETQSGNQDVLLTFKPASTLNLSVMHFFKSGRKNRFHLEAGYAVPLTSNAYRVEDGSSLTSDAVNVLDVIQPGGIIIGLGFSFGL